MSEDSPRLRAVEAFPVEEKGERFIALRDPAGYTSSIVVVPAALVEILTFFDGQHSLVDIQAELMRRYGEIVPRAQLEQIVADLDEHGFMDNSGFAERQAAIDREFLAAPRRPAAHAGGAYPDDPETLREAMDAFFAEPEGPGAIQWSSPTGDVRGVIAPHIDFHRGGPVYAWAYRQLAERSDADLFVIFGTCHAGMAHPFALTRKDYDTPFEPARVDRDFVEMVTARAGQEYFGSELAHRSEHSIEFQAVFLQYLYGGRRDITIVPILASFTHEALARGRRPADDRDVSKFLDAVGDTLVKTGRRAIVIAGADLAHMGPRFGDPAPMSPEELARIEREDLAMLDTVAAGDAESFFAHVARDGDQRRICGLSPIYGLLAVLGGVKGDLRRYGQWPDPGGVVTFASMVF